MSDSAFVFLTRDGIADPGQETKLAALKERLSKPAAKLLLHLHGGLVDEAAGKATAARLQGQPPKGWGLDGEWTQVYVVWRTGAFETLRTNWEDLLHNDRLYQTILRKLVEFVARKLGVPSAGGRSAEAVAHLDGGEIAKRLRGEGDRRDPFGDIEIGIAPEGPQGRGPVLPPQSDASLAQEFQSALIMDPEFNAAVADLDAVVNAGILGRGPAPAGVTERGGASYARLDRAVRARMEAARQQGVGGRGFVGVAGFLVQHGARIAYRCFKRFRSQRDHGFYATLVEELARELYGDLLGAAIWGMMVRDAKDHFRQTGFGTAFLDAFPAQGSVKTIVTAHSAGSIWATRMLQAIEGRGLPVSIDLVLLAPAVRSDLFADMLRSCASHIRRCRMFTMEDALERKNAVLGHDKGYIYPSSLLYLVSGLFEELEDKAFVDSPLVGMQRFTGAPWLTDSVQAAAAQRIAAFFQQAENGIVYAQVPDVCMADTHSGFASEETTLRSVKGLFGP